MVNKLTILAVLVVALSVASIVHGLPTAQSADREELSVQHEETTTAKSGYRGWIKGVYDKIRRPSMGCNHTHEGGRGHGVIHWVKSKLGFVKTTTAAPTTTTVIAGSKDDGGVDDRRPDVESPGAGTPEIGDERRPETGDGDTSPSDAENAGRPVESEGGDESAVGDDMTPLPTDENDANGFSDEDLTPQDAMTIDPRFDARMRP